MNANFYCDPAYSGCGALPGEPCKEDCAKATAAREHVLSRLAGPPTKTPPQMYAATLYRFPTKEEPGEIPLIWASAGIGAQYMTPNASSAHWMNPMNGPANERYILHVMYPRADIMPGWLQIQIRLEVGMTTVGDGVTVQYPVNIYDADVTDINTGLVKFPPMPVWDHRGHSNQAIDGVVFMLGMRRSM